MPGRAKEHCLKRILMSPLLAVHLLAGAAVLEPGQALPSIDLADQHERPVSVARDTRLIFFAAEMEGSRLMTKALATLPSTALKDRKAVYIADISGMPGLVSIMFAVPKMQREAYTVALIRNAGQAANLPRKPGAVTVLRVDAGKVSAVEFARDLQQINQHL